MVTDGSLCYHSQFGGAKFSRVRWFDSEERQAKFITSTYDHRNCEIAAWSVLEESGLTDDIFTCECKLKVAADVNDLVLYNGRRVAAALNDGTVRLLEYDEGVIKPLKKFRNLHNGCPCNALCYNNDKIICGGQGGTLVLINLDDNSTKLISSGMASIRSLVSINQHTFVSAHLDGQVCLWDLREEAESSLLKPTFSCRVTENFQGATALAVHPAEPNLIGFGAEDGCIGFLDTCSSSYMLNCVAVPFPVGSVWEVAFHPVYPSNFYCATGKGHLLHLSVKDCSHSYSMSNFNMESRSNAWLSPSVRSGNANVKTLIDGLSSVNTFDISTHGIIACSDNQMITCITKDYID